MRRLNQDGFVIALSTIVIILGALGIGGFFVWGLASINWQGILAVFAAGTIAMAMAGFLFFGAKFEYVIVCCLIALAIVFILEVTFPVLVGGILVLVVAWNLKWLSKTPILMGGLIVLGLAMMLIVKLSMMGP